jgi:hypothetical protein
MGTILDPDVIAKRPDAELIRVVPPAPDEAIVTIDLDDKAIELVPTPPVALLDENRT